MLSRLLLALLLVGLLVSSTLFVNALAQNGSGKKRVFILFDTGNWQAQQQIISSIGGKVHKDFRPFMQGVSVDIDPSLLPSLQVLKQEFSGIKDIQEDLQVHAEDMPPAGSEYFNDGAWSVAHINAYPADAAGIKGDGVKVAVLDTGIDYNHPDLASNYAGGYNFVNMTSDPFDDNGHGTFVSGIIAANQDGKGIIGVAPDAKIYALKVLDSNGIGYVSDIVAALQWCIDNKMDVVSMSFGLPSSTQALADEVTAAYNAGIVMVAAAGNEGTNQIDYPAAYPQVIAVGATDSNNVRASFSSTGSKLELVAPGVNVVSTVPVSMGSYGSENGTSAAAPHVAGVVALIKSSNEKLWYPTTNGDGIWTNDEIRAVMDTSADDLGVDGRDTLYGYGEVDAGKAVKVAHIGVDTQFNGSPLAGFYATLSQNGAVISSGFSPARFYDTTGSQYVVSVSDYGQYTFDHWQDTGSTVRNRALNLTGDTDLTAVYTTAGSPSDPPPSQPSITVKSVDSSNNTLYGYYATESQGGAVVDTGFTPTTFTASSGQTYTVSVSDYGGYYFNHWSDGTTTRDHTVTVGSTGITLTAVYSTTPAASPDFAISASPSSITVQAGSSGKAGIFVSTTTTGFAGSITLSASSLPAGVTATFNPASVYACNNPNSSAQCMPPQSNLTLAVSSGAASGTYTITVTGTSGSVQHSAAITLAVYSPTSTANLLINSQDSSGNPLTGYWTVVSQSGTTVQTGFTPLSATLAAGTYDVTVGDYGGYYFNHWSDGTTTRDHSVTIGTTGATTTLTAVYSTTAQPPPSSTPPSSPPPSQPSIIVKSVDSSSNPLSGYYTTLSQNGATLSTAFTPATFAVTAGQQYTIEVQDYGNYHFDHWADNGSTNRDRTVTATNSSMTLTAVYISGSSSSSPPSSPPSSGQSTISVSTADSSGSPLAGYYVTLWLNGTQIQSGFSPTSFTVNNNQTYQVAVSDYGSYVFDHWSDGTTSRLHTVTTGTGTTTSLTAVYR